MFFDLVRRNSRRSRKENSLLFVSLLVSIVSFYIILSLSKQDVMVFLRKMESDAVDKLMALIPAFYGVTLFILFFLIYFASRYQLERRSHELGVYLMLGMRRTKLFLLLMAEDLWGSLLSLALGIPTAVLVSELISLITARLVGIGILGHQSVFSLEAIGLTVAGFLLIKCLAFVLLSGKIAGKEIGRLLASAPDGAKRQLPAGIYLAALALGMLLLGMAYHLAIRGISWTSMGRMGVTMFLGILGTFLLFYGLRVVLGFLAEWQGRKRLWVFQFRQLQEQVIHQSASLAISSLLILAAMCFFGYGVAITWSRSAGEAHILDYTFSVWEDEDVEKILKENGLSGNFEELFEMNVGYVRVRNQEVSVRMPRVMELLEDAPDSEEKEVLLNNLGYADYPHVISLSGYNRLLRAAGLEEIQLGPRQAVVYMDEEFTNAARTELMNQVLSQEPEIEAAGDVWHITGTVQSRNLVVDSSITLSFALIVPDEDFQYLTGGEYDTYWDAILAPELVESQGLMQAIAAVNTELGTVGLAYESYLQNMGRQLFYVVAASYLTLYLAVIFLIVANTVLGVQFLMQQQKTGKRYRTLVRLGSSYEMLCASAQSQIRWYFGLPTLAAVVSSLFGVRALFRGMLPSSVQNETAGLLMIALAMICLLCVIEWCYLKAASRASSRYILTLMEPEREE
ncbi:ABC transporter permease [Lachnospiraceae bacterium 46-15]